MTLRPSGVAGDGGFWLRLALLWLSGACLRMTVLSVPPVLPLIHRQLDLSEAQVGALTALPIFLLTAAAIPGAVLIARVGARRALIAGLCLVALAGAARSLGQTAIVLFAMTFLMGVGIAVSQPTMPTLARFWFPTRTGQATAAYANGFLIGEIVAAALTGAVILPRVGGDWQLALLVWSVPVLLTAVCILLFTSHVPRERTAPRIRWWPDWRSQRTWRLGLIFGGASVAYFGANAFIPDYLKATNHASLISAGLTSLNLCQLPASLLIAALPGLFIARRWPIVATGVVTVISGVGFVMGGLWIVLWAGTLGFATASVFVLTLALPPLLADPHDVPRLSAAMFTITYACSFVGSLIGGAIWDASGIPFTAFLPVIAAGLGMILLVIGLDLSHARRRSTEESNGETQPRLAGRPAG